MASSYFPRLIIMAKPPLAGMVKTRLSRDIGTAAATSFYRLSTKRLLHRLGRDPRWQTILAVNASESAAFECWPNSIVRMPQGEGDLGQRMSFVLDNAPPGPVAIIGTDSPQIEPRNIARAFKWLRSKDAVFGPSTDGGYWLIGLARKRAAPDLFQGVRWSTQHALKDTAASLPHFFSVKNVKKLSDVDEGKDHSRLLQKYGAMRFGPWRV